MAYRKAGKAGPRRDVAAEVTEKIIKALEAGTVPWHRPWASTGGQHGGDRACYSPELDMVRMPERDLFASPARYYSTLFHELGHSTGHARRLNRDGIVEGHRFGDALYSAEELVAEMTAALLCAHTGIEQAETVAQSAAYIDSWLRVLRSDHKMVLQAAAKAQAASDLIAPEELETAEETAEEAPELVNA